MPAQRRYFFFLLFGQQRFDMAVKSCILVFRVIKTKNELS